MDEISSGYCLLSIVKWHRYAVFIALFSWKKKHAKFYKKGFLLALSNFHTSIYVYSFIITQFYIYNIEMYNVHIYYLILYSFI